MNPIKIRGTYLAKDIINQRLEHSWGIGKTKRHDQILKVAQWRVKCCLPLIILMYLNQMVSIAKVQLRTEPSLVERTKCRIKEG